MMGRWHKMISLLFLSLLAATAMSLPRDRQSTQNYQLAPRRADADAGLSTQIGQDGADDKAYLYICVDIDFSGKCEHLTYTLGSGDCTPLLPTYSSLGPDPGYSCTFYKNTVCRDFSGNDTDKLTMEYPGSGNLFNIEGKGNWNDVAQSFQCFKKG